MKVALFSRYPRTFGKPRGGVESVTVILSKALSRLDGMEVHLITLEKGVSNEVFEQDGKVNIHRLTGSSWPQIFDILFGPGKRRLKRKIKDIYPDIVHSHETFGLTLGNIHIPHVFTVHGFDHANIPSEGRKAAWLRSKVWRYVEHFGLSHHKKIISISPYVTGMIKTHTSGKIYEIDNPVDERYFVIERRIGENRVLCVGWINERKNTLGSVRAFAEALKQGRKGTLAIAGEAQEKSYLDKVNAAVRELNMEEHVEFLGHINHDQLENELARANVMLLPSLQENAPMAISEAMAAGVPVIASNLCGMPFMVKEGESGFLINPHDTGAIADRLSRILKSEELQEKMGKRGREIAFARFHPDVVAAKTRDIYLEALK